MKAAAALALPALAIACGVSCAPPAAPPPRPVAAPSRSAADPPLAPARWAYVDRLGALFDEAGRGSPLPRPEPVIVDGVRVVVEAGVVVASARHADRFSGFRTLPDRLGRGLVLWSEDRVYRADDFLGDPRPIADVGAAGGARPWLTSVLLRTPLGLLELDPRALTLRRAGMPGVVDALALDARRGVRLDALGRASFTLDGGASWTDVFATRGARVRGISEGADGKILLATDIGPHLALGATGDLAPIDPRAAPIAADPHPTEPLLDPARPASSRVLPGELLAQAVVAGALLPGGRILVARQDGVRVLAAATGLPVADTDLPGIDARFSRCQAVAVGEDPASSPAVLACVADTGAAVIDLDGSPARPALEATFRAGGGFVGGPRGRLAFDGPCGPDPPASTDLGPGTPHADLSDDSQGPLGPPVPAPARIELPPAELPRDDDARACVRASSSHWLERRLRGEDARRLYRWVPGDAASVTAIVLARKVGEGDGGASGGASSRPGDGVRVIRVDPEDPALGGGAFPAVAPPQQEAPHRSVDVSYWEDDDGSIRGWIVLPAEGEERVPAPPSAQGPAHRPLPVSRRRGGRAAGVRIDAAGHVTTYALPRGTAQVITGGRFALAMTTGTPVPAWFETVDGGVSWTPVAGPPVGTLDPPGDDDALFGCSPIGCAWASGVVRLGWGGPRPAPAPDLVLTAAAGPRLRAPEMPALDCRFDGDRPVPRPIAGKPAHPPIALELAALRVGELRDHTWTGEVLPPFQPAAAPRRLSATDPTLHANLGSVVPILGAGVGAPVDVLLLVDKHRLRAGAGAASFLPFGVSGRFTVAADLPGEALAIFDADRGSLWISRGDATASALHLVRVSDVAHARLTLARRLAGGALALAGYSTGTGEIFAGDLDLGRAAVGPLAGIGRLEALGEAGACPQATHRMIVELPVRLRVRGRGGESALDPPVTASALIAAGTDRVCVEAVEAVLHKGDTALLRATLGPGGSASLWSGGTMMRGACSIETR